MKVHGFNIGYGDTGAVFSKSSTKVWADDVCGATKWGFFIRSLAPIVGLFFSCSPFAIFKHITFIVINSFKRQSFRFFSHIGKKVFKGITPTRADLNATASIAIIKFKVRIFATVNHTAPNTISRCPAHTVFKPVGFIFTKTTTTFGAPISNALAHNNFRIATNTDAIPINMTFRYMGKGFYNKTTEALTSKFETLRHDILRRCSERLSAEGSRKLLFGVYTLSAHSSIA